ncbi:MAG: hypothetical protein B7X11_00155 [Acidobacteria bacterium 37-65-4]|nr:MAG: hypothetical protein B7X11_00155 [Acidobacteria bacterium 37-65-4]
MAVTTAPGETRPVLWLRPQVRRAVLVEHLLHIAGAFVAAGWEVVRGDLDTVPAGSALAVLDDPWAEPLPRLAWALAAARIAGPPVWRVPRLLGLTGPQGWNPAVPPATMREYERRTVARGRGTAVPLVGPAAWNGFAVAAPEDAAELLRRGWPPERAVVLTNLRLFRYADPAGHERRELLPFVPVAARTVVDVGCGSGLFGSLLRRPGRRVLGIEPEWELARQARTRLDLVLPLSGDDGLRAVRPPVDCVVFADVLEHTVAPHQLLRAAAGALGPGGRIVVSFPNAAWAPVVRALAAGRWDLTLAGVQARDHLFFTTPRSFAALAAECGLAVETMAPLGGGVSWRGRAWAHLLALASGGDPAAMAAPQWMVVLRAS